MAEKAPWEKTELAPWEKELESGDSADPKTVADPSMEGLEGSEAAIPERIARGVLAAPRAVAEVAAPLLAQPAQQQAEALPYGVKTAKKFKTRHIEDDPIELGASFFNPVPLGVTAGVTKFATKAPKLAQGMIAGGITGLLEPTGHNITDPEFGPAKFKQGATGLGMGFGFTLAGKGVSAGVNKVADYLVRHYPENLTNDAVKVVLNQILRDEKYGGLSAKNALDLIQEAQSKGIPMTMADIGSLDRPQTAMRGLTSKMAARPENRQLATHEMRARDRSPLDENFVGPHRSTTPERTRKVIAEHISSGESAFQATEMLIQSRRAHAQPLWEETDKLQNIWSPYLEERLLKNPEIKEGLRRGFHFERMAADAENRPFNPTMMGVDLDELGQIKILKTPNMRVLQMAKEGLDAMIAEARNEHGLLTKEGMHYQKLKRAFVDEIDSLDKNKVYKKARDAWAGESANMDAIKLGKAIFGTHPEEVMKEFSRMGAGEQEFFRLGVADIMKERLMKAGVTKDEVKFLTDNPWIQEHLKPVVKDFKGFMNTVTKESQMHETLQRVESAAKGKEREEAMESSNIIFARIFEGVHQAVKGNPLRMLGNAYRLRRDLGLKPDAKLNEAVAKILFTPEGPRLLRTPPARTPGRGPRLQQIEEDISPYLGAEVTAQTQEGQPEPIEPEANVP